jgi:hypothetical protein
LKESKDAKREIELQIKASFDCEYIVKIKDVYINREYYYVNNNLNFKKIIRLYIVLKNYLFSFFKQVIMEYMSGKKKANRHKNFLIYNITIN